MNGLSESERRFDLETGLDALRKGPSFSGPIEPLDGHESNGHLALIYESRREQFDTAVPFIGRGLDRGEQCLYIADENSTEAVLDAMRERGVDVDAAVESGALQVAAKQDSYLEGGDFDPDQMIGFLADAIDEATEEYERLRITGETTWVFTDGASTEDLVEYEAKVNDLLSDENCIALCQYNRERFSPSVLRDIVRTHPHLVYDGTVCQNFYYTPPEEFFGPERPGREVDRMLGTLLERTRAKTALRERTEALRERHDIVSRSDLSFHEKLRRFLELGCERFDLDVGYLTHAVDGQVEVVDSVGDRETIQPGSSAPVAETYCNKVLKADDLVSTEDASEPGQGCIVAYREYGLGSHLGTAVTVGGEQYGTLCFASHEPREKPFSDAEIAFLELTEEWVSYELEREHREAQLAALNEMSRDLMDAEGYEDIIRSAVEHAEDTLRLPLTAFVQYDTGAGQLRIADQTSRAADEFPTSSLTETPSGPLWDGFTAGEVRIVEDVGAISGAGDDITELVAVPLGSHGLLVTATEATDGFGEAELDFVRTTAATVETACDRADREQLLQEREHRLEEQNDSLERLNRINDTIRNIGQALVQASTREEVEQVVCAQLAEIGPYELAWVGEYDSVTDEVSTREWAGAEKGYLDAITVTADGSDTGRGPGGKAVRTREPQVVNDIVDDQAFRPWRREALNRGYHAAIALPLVYGDALYGVLVVYANQPGVFDDLERSVLAELSDTIAFAINAVESKKALVSDEVTELEFEVEDEELEVLELSNETGCALRLEGVVPRTDGKLRAFVSTRDVPPEEILSFAPKLATSGMSLVSEYEGEDGPVCLFEATLSEGSLCETVRAHGGRPQTLTVEDGVGTVVVELAADADIREFVETFTHNYPESELVAQRSRERDRQTPMEFRSALTEKLTDRQLEVLQTAYFSGYFEQPRDQTGSEIAESLDISQPTFNTHVRAAQRKLSRQLFESDCLSE